MGKKTDTNLDAAMQGGAATQDVAPINDDDLQDVFNNATTADAEPENAATAQASDVEASRTLTVDRHDS